MKQQTAGYRIWSVNKRTNREVQLTDPMRPPVTLQEANTMKSKLTAYDWRRIEIRGARK